MARTSRPYAIVRITVDLAILTVREGALQVLLIERDNEPFRGHLALPGGFLRDGEGLDTTARRELREETGLSGLHLHLQQLHTFDRPDRDPRGRVITVPYLAIAPDLPTPVPGSDASAARWIPVDSVGVGSGFRLAFDHDEILGAAVERARQELEYTTLATVFCQDTFTIGDLRQVYEVVWGVRVDPRNFSRKVTGTEGFVVPTGGKRLPETGRPAALYRKGPATTLYPAMLRPTVEEEHTTPSIAAPGATRRRAVPAG